MRLNTHVIVLFVCSGMAAMILTILLKSLETRPPDVELDLPRETTLPFITGALPTSSVIDVNIGTSYDPMVRREDRGLILVEPLFKICEHLATSATLAADPETVLFCMAISNTTTFATFLEFHKDGVASSLAALVSNDYQAVSRRNVLVMEGVLFFEMLLNNRPLLVVECLKLDMQGFELTLLRHMEPLLTDPRFEFRHIFAECMCPDRPLYEVDNGCDHIDTILTRAGYTVAPDHITHCNMKPKPPHEWSDVRAWKAPGTGSGGECTWEGKRV